MTVKRYTLMAHQSFPDLPAEVVAASDYDALAARLANIEAQNRVMWDVANDREARLAEAQSLIVDATAELLWWIDEHPCCKGHEGDLLTRLAAFGVASSVPDAENEA